MAHSTKLINGMRNPDREYFLFSLTRQGDTFNIRNQNTLREIALIAAIYGTYHQVLPPIMSDYSWIQGPFINIILLFPVSPDRI